MELDGQHAVDQPPKLTVDWALRGVELALRNLGDGAAEQRVRRQFHQLLLAIERQTPPDTDALPDESSVPPPFPDSRR
jgi:hypothetical protein